MSIPRRPDLPAAPDDRRRSRRERAMSVLVLGGVAVLLGIVAVADAARTRDTGDDRIVGATGSAGSVSPSAPAPTHAPSVVPTGSPSPSSGQYGEGWEIDGEVDGFPVSWRRYEVPDRFRVVAPSGAEAAFDDGYWHLLSTDSTTSYAVYWRAAPISEGERPHVFLEDQLGALGRYFTVPASGVRRYHRGEAWIVEASYREPGIVTRSRLIWQKGFFYRVDAATRGRPGAEVALFFESFHPL